MNPARPRGGEVPAELRRSAERSNRYDIELYRYAKELFETRLSSRDLEFEVELAALEAAKADGEPDVKTPCPRASAATRRRGEWWSAPRRRRSGWSSN